MLNKPNQLAQFGLCGNGVLDDGEDCDCGSPDDCAKIDPCCDPVTCRLKREAQCSAGPCCDDNCRVSEQSTACGIENKLWNDKCGIYCAVSTPFF